MLLLKQCKKCDEIPDKFNLVPGETLLNWGVTLSLKDLTKQLYIQVKLYKQGKEIYSSNEVLFRVEDNLSDEYKS